MSLSIGILVFPGVQQLDVTAPYEIFAMLPGSAMHLPWRDRAAVTASTGLVLVPTTSFADCPPLDILCVPGGAGITPLLGDDATLDFLRRQAAQARFVVSVCAGALLLGAAGLLKGRRATTHWMSHDLLAAFGAVPVAARVVEDGPVWTAAGITAGIDLSLRVVAAAAGRDAAEMIQLYLEYAPDPPFSAGTPETAPPAVLAALRQRLLPTHQARTAWIAARTGGAAAGGTD